MEQRRRFADWLQEKLNQRGWSQGDLWRQSKAYGREVSRAQISHILNETRGAGPDTCINIAYALSISREEVFKARGWLLVTREEIIPPDTPPATAELIRELTALDSEAQKTVSEALLPALRLFTQVNEEEAKEPSGALQEEPSQPEVAAPLVPIVDWIAELNDYPDHIQRDMVGVLKPRIRGLIDKLAEMWAYQEFLNKPLTQEEAIEFGETIAEFKRLFPGAWGPIEERVFGRRGGYKAASQGESMAAAA